MLLESKLNYDDAEHACCIEVSSQEDDHWDPFLNEYNVEEAEIDKLLSGDSNLQSNAEPKEFNTDTQH